MRELFKLVGMISMSGVEGVKSDLNAIDKQVKVVQRSFARTGRKVEQLGKTLSVRLSAPLTALSGLVGKVASDFDKAFTESTAIMGNLSDNIKNEMKDAAKQVAETTTSSAKEAAEGYYFLASAGYDAAQAIGALPKVAKFAQAGAFDLALATDLLTDAQSALGLSSKDAAVNTENLIRLSDALVKANTIANASVQQFSESLTNKGAAALRMLKKDMNEGLGVLAAFADQGDKGAAAGEKLHIVFRDLQTASIRNKKAFNALGVSVYGADGKMRHIADILKDLENLLANATDEQKKLTLSTLGFQDKSVAALQTLIGTSEKIREYESALKEAGGTTEDVANKQLQSFANWLKIVRNRITNVMITIGDKLLPVLKDMLAPVIDKVINGLQRFANWFDQLSPKTKKMVVLLTGFAIAFGPLLILTGKFIFMLKTLIPLYKALALGQLTLNAAMTANPIGLIVVGIGALIAAIIAVATQWDYWKEKILFVWKLLRMSPLAPTIFLIDILIEAGKRLYKNWDKIAAYLKYLYARFKDTSVFKFLLWNINTIKMSFTLFVNAIKKLFGGFNDSWEDLVDKVFEGGSYIKTTFLRILEAFIALHKPLLKLIPGLGKKFDALKESVKALRKEEEADRVKRLLDVKTRRLNAEAIAEETKKIEEQQKAKEKGLQLPGIKAPTKEELDTILTGVKPEDAQAKKEAERAKRKAEKLAEKKRAIEEKYNRLSEGSTEKLLKLEYEKSLQAKELTEVEKIKLEEKYNRDKKELKLKNLETERLDAVFAAEQLNADTKVINDYYELQRQEALVEAANKEMELARQTAAYKKQLAQDYVDTFVMGVGMMFGVMNDFSDNALEREEQRKQKAIERIETTIVNENDKAKAIEDIEADSDKKIRAIKRKQARREKLMGIFSVGISTAQAIMKAYSDLGPIGGTIAAIFIGALGLAQQIAIAAKPIPLEEGGLAKKKPNGILANIAEGDEDELIFPLVTGTKLLAKMLVDKIKALGDTGRNMIGGMTPAPVLAAGTVSRSYAPTFNIGTLVGSDDSFRRLARELRPYQLQEEQRQGL